MHDTHSFIAIMIVAQCRANVNYRCLVRAMMGRALIDETDLRSGGVNDN